MSKREVEILSGTVANVVYESDDFRIVKLILDNSHIKHPVSCKGSFPAQQIQVGTWVSFEGFWDNHPQWGPQLSVVRSPVAVTYWTDERALAALTAHGVGPGVRATLRAYAKGQNTTLQRLLDSGDLGGAGLDEIAKDHALATWRRLRTYLDAASFMQEAGIPPAVIGRVWSKFGTDLEAEILKDPWVLVRVGGISFQDADQIAIRLNVSFDNPGRVKAAVITALKENVFEGHVYSTTNQVVTKVSTLIQKPSPTPPQIADSIKSLMEEGSVVLDREALDGVRALYDKWHWETEVECARLLREKASQVLDEEEMRKSLSRVSDTVAELEKTGAPLREVASAAIGVWAKGNKVSLTEEQTEAVLRALLSPVSLLTGLPGTGKTTSLMAAVSLAKDMSTPFLLIAPTGIAAKRMSSVTGSTAATVHRAFGAKGFMKEGEERESSYVGVTGASSRDMSEDSPLGDWEYGPGNLHPAKIVIVDESSMVDLHMLYRILSATQPDSRLLFVGDPYQLPSVGAGDVLRDLVNAKVFPHTHLDKIFRQQETSGIVLAAHATHRGKSPSFSGDFALVGAQTEEDARELILQIAARFYEKRANFQVLSPRHAGDAGVTSLNEGLRMALNPPKSGHAEMRFGGGLVREGDRVMVVRNDYNKGVFNGDVGKIDRIDRKSKEVTLKIFEGDGRPPNLVRYSFKQISKAIRLSYAQTVHKSQGQEYDVIVLPVLRSFGQQLQRNLFYTAITRAKKRVVLVGEESAIRKAVENDRAQERNTLLSARLRASIEAPAVPTE